MADEKLIIDVVARDGISPVLDKAGQNVSGFTKEAEANFKRMDAAVGSVTTGMQRAGTNIDATKKKAIDFADAAQKKFEALGKAAIGIFAADVAAKVLGFSSALDVVNKAAEGVADTIKRIGLAVQGLPTDYEKAERAALRFEQAVAQAREQRERGDIGFNLRNADLGVNSADVNIGRFLGIDPAGFSAAVQEAERIREEFRALGIKFQESNNPSRFDNPADREAARASAQDLVAAIDARLNAAVASALKSAQAQFVPFSQSATPFGPEAPDVFDIPRGFQFVTPPNGAQFGPDAPEIFDIPSGFEFIPTPNARRSGGSGSGVSPAFNAANARRRAVAERAAANRARNQVQPLIPDLSTDLLGEQTRQLASFADQAAESFNRLGDSVRNSIGDQVVLGSFNALTNFFAAAVQGQATLRDLGRSFVQLGAQILAQQAALRVLGFFGFGGAVASSAGGVGGAGAAAGGATAGTLGGGGGFNLGGGGIPIGVQGGGGGVSASINLNVTSLDPRGAADVVLSQMPAIQRALAQSITSGASRSLRVAVGSV